MNKFHGLKKFMVTPRRQPSADPPEDLSLATRAAWLSYIGGHTQGEIARRLQVSPAKAHRLIALANRHALVKVFIERVPAECIALEQVLLDRFALNTCIVAPDMETAAPGGVGAITAVAAAGARFLHRQLEAAPAGVIGVGKGRTLAATVARMPPLARADLRFVSVSGSLTRKLAANPFDVVHSLIERTGGEGYFLPVPYIAATLEEKNVLLAQKSVCELLALARQSQAFAIGIGALDDEAHVRQAGMLSAEEWAALRRLDAVGDLMGSFLDRAGRPVDSPVNRQAVGLSIEDLRGRRVIALAGGAHKAEAILAALRTGVITDLVLDETAARPIAATIARDAASAA